MKHYFSRLLSKVPVVSSALVSIALLAAEFSPLLLANSFSFAYEDFNDFS